MFFKSGRKSLNDGHFKIFATAYTEQGGHVGNNPEPLRVTFHHIGPTFIMHIYGLHNVFPLFLQNALLRMSAANKDSDSDSDFLILILPAKSSGRGGRWGERGGGGPLSQPSN